MASGFFLGGLGEGVTSGLSAVGQFQYQQGILKLAQQREQNEQQRQLFARADSHVADFSKLAATTADAFAAAHPNASDKEIAMTIAPIKQQAMSIAQAAGRNPNEIDASFTAIVTAAKNNIVGRAELAKTQAETAKTQSGTKLINQTVENNAAPANPANPDLDTDTQLGGADAQVKGQNFLHSLPGSRGLNAQGLYDGTTPITAFSTRTGKNNTKSQRQQAVEDAETYGALIGKPFDINRAANLKIAETAQNKADSSTLTQLTQNKQALSAFEDTAKNNTKVLLDLAKKVPDTGSPLLNRPIRSLAKDALGNPDVAAFNLQLQSVKNEMSRIITNPRLVGQLTDNARSELNAALDPGATVGIILSAYNTVVKDFTNRSAGLDKSISEVKDRLSGKSKPPEHTYNPDTGELE